MVAPCQYNFNTRTGAMGKTGVAPKKQNYHCMVAGIELEQYATGHEMSNQRSEKAELPQHKPGSPWKNWYNLRVSLFCNAISDQMGQRTCTAWKKHFGTLLLQLQQSHPCELARLGWLPRQAKLPLHGGRRTTGRICHWP